MRQRGTDHPNHTLDESKVQEIRKAAASGEAYRAIAKRFGIMISTVSKVVTRKSWTHVP